jgi:hypothetical protein
MVNSYQDSILNAKTVKKSDKHPAEPASRLNVDKFDKTKTKKT